MERFKNILVIVEKNSDFDGALERAEKLAKNNGARLTVAACIEETGGHGVVGDLGRAMVDAATTRIESLGNSIGSRGVPVRTRVLVGRPFIEIIRQVLRNKHDLVMKTAEGKDTFGSLLFGSTDLHLLRKCPCPVWMISPSPRQPSGGVLAAVAFDSEDGEQQALNTMIMQLATSLSLLERSELHVVHAWSLRYEESLRHSGFIPVPEDEVNRQVREARAWHKQRFDELVARFKDVVPSMEPHFLKGDAKHIVPLIAKEKNIEVIVMATLARSGIAGLLIGNTAEMVLNQVECSVLAIKPAGFGSPVTLDHGGE